MAAELDVLGETRVIMELPGAPLDDLIAAGEVMLQEGLTWWSLPVSRAAELVELRGLFGHRATFCLHDVRTSEQAQSAADAEVALIFSPLADPELVTAAGATPIVLGALTPTEVDRAVRAGAAAVQVIPCDAMGTLYARVLPGLFPNVPLIAAGRLERFQADMWLEAGAVAVMPLGQITTAHVTDPDLAELRRRCQALV